ncbi:MAG: hypothetical protein ACOCZ7_00180 [Armatimonadota bacterium]
MFGEIANSDYEGEISDMGDKVQIRVRPDIQIRKYERGQELDIQVPEANKITLTIDHADYFNVLCDDVDEVQSDIDKMNEFTDDATEQMQISIDSEILADIYTDADEDNAGTSAGKQSGNIDLGEASAPVEVTSDNAIDKIVDMGTVLDEQNIPQQGRWVVLPPAIVARIKKSDLKDASLAGDGTSILRNGRVGMIDRFTVYSSNNLERDSDDDAWNCVFGHSAGLTYASQIAQTEQVKSEKYFGYFIRGLNVFGYKVTNPEAIGHFYASVG